MRRRLSIFTQCCLGNLSLFYLICVSHLFVLCASQIAEYVKLLEVFVEQRVRISDSVQKRIQGLVNFLNSIKLVSLTNSCIGNTIPQSVTNTDGCLCEAVLGS